MAKGHECRRARQGGPSPPAPDLARGRGQGRDHDERAEPARARSVQPDHRHPQGDRDHAATPRSAAWSREASAARPRGRARGRAQAPVSPPRHHLPAPHPRSLRAHRAHPERVRGRAPRRARRPSPTPPSSAALVLAGRGRGAPGRHGPPAPGRATASASTARFPIASPTRAAAGSAASGPSVPRPSERVATPERSGETRRGGRPAERRRGARCWWTSRARRRGSATACASPSAGSPPPATPWSASRHIIRREPARPHRGGLRGGRARRGSAHRGRVRAQGHQPLRGRRGAGLDRPVLPGGGGARRDRGLGVRRGAVLRRAAGGRPDAAVHAVPAAGSGTLVSRDQPGPQALHRSRSAARRCSRCPPSSPTWRCSTPRQADAYGNVQFVGTGYADRLLWRAADRTLVQVERVVVERGDPPRARAHRAARPRRRCALRSAPIPSRAPASTSRTARTSHELVEAGRAFARTGDRGPFERYLDRYVRGPADHVDYLEAVGLRRLLSLTSTEATCRDGSARRRSRS